MHWTFPRIVTSLLINYYYYWYDYNYSSDDELVQRFNKVFSTEPIATTKNLLTNYHIPDHVYNDDIDKEVKIKKNAPKRSTE